MPGQMPDQGAFSYYAEPFSDTFPLMVSNNKLKEPTTAKTGIFRMGGM